MKIYNITQHDATEDQLNAGIIDLPAELKSVLRQKLTFDTIPTREKLFESALEIFELVTEYDSSAYGVMIGGAPFFMRYLEDIFILNGIKAFYAFTKRIVEEKDGVKKSIFQHAGFVEANLSPLKLNENF